jgi:hypothetical protein
MGKGEEMKNRFKKVVVIHCLLLLRGSN